MDDCWGACLAMSLERIPFKTLKKSIHPTYLHDFISLLGPCFLVVLTWLPHVCNEVIAFKVNDMQQFSSGQNCMKTEPKFTNIEQTLITATLF